MADVTSIYGNPIKDAVARADISTLQTDVQDVKDGIKAINISWEYGSINRDTGAATVTSERIRTNSFTTRYKYLVARAGVAERVIIEIYKYNTDGSYVDYTYLLAKDGYLLAYEFDTSHKYIIVSRSVSVRFGFTAAVDDEIYLSLGAIQSDGSFQPYSTNATIFKPISVTAPKILIANIPSVKTTLFIYDNGTYSGSLRYQDDGNTVAYFPIIPGKTYRLYAETENIESCSVKIVDDAEKQLYTGSIYNGIVIASSGNKRTNLINAANHHYVHIISTVTIYADKYKNGVYTGRSTVYAGVYSPAALDISDCDAFYLLANGVADISYWFDESLVLYDKKWCSYGDSITEQQRWQNYLVAKYHLVLQNKGLGGSCVTGDTSSSVTPMTADSRINTINTDSDIITVMGGTNDFDYCQHMGTVEDLQTGYDTSTFIGSVATIVKKLQARCPNARIILMSNVNSRGTTGQNRDNQQVSPYGYTPYDFAVAMRQAAEWLSVGFVDVWACGINQLNRSKYIEDTVHPNAAGGKLIAQKVMEYFDKINIVS